MTLPTVFLALIFVYSLVSARVERTIFTAPILFTLAGGCVLLLIPHERDMQLTRGTFLLLAEAGLVLLLFTDASRTDLQFLKSIRGLPTRLLSTGMLLTILLGGLAALVCFRAITVWEAGILAAILAPTDAGLGQIIVTNDRVPMRIRQALNVEAGLNDGLSVPFMLFFIALSAPSHGYSFLSRFIGEQLGYGALIGVIIGFLGGWLLCTAHNAKWIAATWLQLGVVALPLGCAVLSEHVAASMFIAAFVAGLAVQLKFKAAGQHSVEFTEEWGQLLNLFVFFIFGALVARDWASFTWAHLLYAIMSLTIVRMLPVALALIGTGLSAATVLFVGWFGPRGLASIVLGLVYLEHADSRISSDIRLAVMLTVVLSIFAHGFSALPGIRLYARRISLLDANAPERDQPSSSNSQPTPAIVPNA